MVDPRSLKNLLTNGALKGSGWTHTHAFAHQKANKHKRTWLLRPMFHTHDRPGREITRGAAKQRSRGEARKVVTKLPIDSLGFVSVVLIQRLFQITQQFLLDNALVQHAHFTEISDPKTWSQRFQQSSTAGKTCHKFDSTCREKRGGTMTRQTRNPLHGTKNEEE